MRREKFHGTVDVNLDEERSVERAQRRETPRKD